jgi:hypothetical protein
VQTEVVKVVLACAPRHPVQDPRVGLQRPGAHPAWEDDYVGGRQVLEGTVDDQAEHPVVGADLAPCVTDEGDVEGRDALQHFVGARSRRAR